MSSHTYYEGPQSFSFSYGGRITYAVQRLILVNIVVFAAQLIWQVPLTGMLNPEYWLAFQPAFAVKGALWQPITYMFLHGSLSHLFFNMLTLFFFGPDVERLLCTRQFFRFFFLCGLGGAAAEFLRWWFVGVDTKVMGASGATLGVLAAFAVAFPRREIYLFPLPFPIYAWAIAALFFVLSLLATGPVAWATHLGGMLTAFGYMKAAPRMRTWLESVPRPRNKKPNSTGVDALGEAVDNIFRFDDEKRRRK
jgi:membrane associated rhomboid family serine protease